MRSVVENRWILHLKKWAAHCFRVTKIPSSVKGMFAECLVSKTKLALILLGEPCFEAGWMDLRTDFIPVTTDRVTTCTQLRWFHLILGSRRRMSVSCIIYDLSTEADSVAPKNQDTRAHTHTHERAFIEWVRYE